MSEAPRDRVAGLRLVDGSGERDAGLISGIKHGLVASNGRRAFVRNVGPQQVPNIFLLEADGGERQLTQWGVANTVEALSPTGELSYFHGSLNEEDFATKRAMVWSDGQTFDIGGLTGALVWRRGGWFLVLGDALFSLERDGGVGDELRVQPLAAADAGPAEQPQSQGCPSGCSTSGSAFLLMLCFLPRRVGRR